MFGYATQRDRRADAAADLAGPQAGQAPGGRAQGRDVVPYLRPDGKTQVSVRYRDGKPVEIEKLLISTQHSEGAESLIPDDLWEHVVEPILPKDLYDASKLRKNFLVNPTGRFVIGGPVGDAGLTGRKIIVDTYGGMARHGGGAFSGKDPSKVDRSAAYAARYVAKNVVAAGLADRCRGPGRLRDRRRAPGLGDGRDVRHREDRPRAGSPSSSTSTSTCARAPSASTSTCTGRSTRRPPPTATSAARTTTSRGSGPTRPRSCARPRAWPASRRSHPSSSRELAVVVAAVAAGCGDGGGNDGDLHAADASPRRRAVGPTGWSASCRAASSRRRGRPRPTSCPRSSRPRTRAWSARSGGTTGSRRGCSTTARSPTSTTRSSAQPPPGLPRVARGERGARRRAVPASATGSPPSVRLTALRACPQYASATVEVRGARQRRGAILAAMSSAPRRGPSAR